MRRLTVVVMLALVSVAASSCGGGEDPVGVAQAAKKPKVYFGWVLGTRSATGVAIQVDDAANGAKAIKAYVCDGLGPPKGKAVWFTGSVDLKTVNSIGRAERFRSASKREVLDIDQLDPRLVKGSFTDAKGARSQYVAYPARDGAGIYEVTLDRKLRYTGVSTDGSRLSAQADRKGLVTGRITTAAGAKIPFAIRTLALASPSELSARGLSPDYRKDVKRSLVPGEYVAVIAPSGTHWLGRAGNVKGGLPAGEIIGLDKKEFTTLSRPQIQQLSVSGQTVGGVSP